MKTCRVRCQPFLSPHATRARILFWVTPVTHWILSAEIVKTLSGSRGNLIQTWESSHVEGHGTQTPSTLSQSWDFYMSAWQRGLLIPLNSKLTVSHVNLNVLEAILPTRGIGACLRQWSWQTEAPRKTRESRSGKTLGPNVLTPWIQQGLDYSATRNNKFPLLYIVSSFAVIVVFT